jgi:hypothetical protein
MIGNATGFRFGQIRQDHDCKLIIDVTHDRGLEALPRAVV